MASRQLLRNQKRHGVGEHRSIGSQTVIKKKGSSEEVRVGKKEVGVGWQKTVKEKGIRKDEYVGGCWQALLFQME